jgi:dienelactone hydrolase
MKNLLFFILVVTFNSYADSHEGEKFLIEVPHLKPGQIVKVTETTDTIRAYFYKPAGDGPFPAVIDLHGCNGIWPRRSDIWKEKLISWGYAVIQVDSFSTRKGGDICKHLFKINTTQRAYDAYAVRNFFIKNKYLHPEKIAVMGFSHGATTVLVSLLNEFHKKESISQGRVFKVAIALAPWCFNARGKVNNTNTKLLILIGEYDDWTPAPRCTTMSTHDKNNYQLIILKKAYHSYDVPDLSEVYLGHRVQYSKKAAEKSYIETQMFLDKYLGSNY